MITFKHTISLAALLISLPLGAMERQRDKFEQPQKIVMATLKRYIKDANKEKFMELIHALLGIPLIEGVGMSPFVVINLDEIKLSVIKVCKEEIEDELEIRRDPKALDNAKFEDLKSVGSILFSGAGLILSGIGFSVSGDEGHHKDCEYVSELRSLLCLVSIFSGVVSCKKVYDGCKNIHDNGTSAADQKCEYLSDMKDHLSKILESAKVIPSMPKQIKPSAPNEENK